jgi:hypothetical protein
LVLEAGESTLNLFNNFNFAGGKVAGACIWPLTSI